MDNVLATAVSRVITCRRRIVRPSFIWPLRTWLRMPVKPSGVPATPRTPSGPTIAPTDRVSVSNRPPAAQPNERRSRVNRPPLRVCWRIWALYREQARYAMVRIPGSVRDAGEWRLFGQIQFDDRPELRVSGQTGPCADDRVRQHRDGRFLGPMPRDERFGIVRSHGGRFHRGVCVRHE